MPRLELPVRGDGNMPLNVAVTLVNLRLIDGRPVFSRRLTRWQVYDLLAEGRLRGGRLPTGPNTQYWITRASLEDWLRTFTEPHWFLRDLCAEYERTGVIDPAARYTPARLYQQFRLAGLLRRCRRVGRSLVVPDSVAVEFARLRGPQ